MRCREIEELVTGELTGCWPLELLLAARTERHGSTYPHAWVLMWDGRVTDTYYLSRQWIELGASSGSRTGEGRHTQ